MNSREVIVDINREFDYLTSNRFKPCGETITAGRVLIGFLGKDFNISLSFSKEKTELFNDQHSSH